VTKRNDHVYSWLGSGISLPFEKKVSDVLTIRPRAIESDIEKLRDKASSQFEYGLLCSIAPTITFELETSAETPSSEIASEPSITCKEYKFGP
jgi:hypothetical protein